jgi:hypothetical protein|nr:MAG TPA: hypothetical protein [Caudoviricetes sp.]
MNLLDKKQYQTILISVIGNKNLFKQLVEENTFKNYAGEPVGQVVKLKATLDVLETFLSFIKQGYGGFTTEDKEELTELLRYYQGELAKARDRKAYHKQYYKEHRGRKGE